MDKKELAEKLKAGVKAQREQEQILKISDTPQDLTPLERAKALRRKAANQYDNYIAKKLLPGLEK